MSRFLSISFKELAERLQDRAYADALSAMTQDDLNSLRTRTQSHTRVASLVLSYSLALPVLIALSVIALMTWEFGVLGLSLSMAGTVAISLLFSFVPIKLYRHHCLCAWAVERLVAPMSSQLGAKDTALLLSSTDEACAAYRDRVAMAKRELTLADLNMMKLLHRARMQAYRAKGAARQGLHGFA